MSLSELKAIVRRLEKLNKYEKVLEGLFDKQKDAADGGRQISILTSRRAGKSYFICSLMIHLCATKRNSSCLYLALTNQNVKRIALGLIKNICKKYDIPIKVNKVPLTVEFLETDSVIELSGADDTKDAAEKFLGAAYDIVAIDEAGSFDPIILDYLIDSIIRPTLIDREGRLILAGTPREVESGRFYITTIKEKEGWERYSWNTVENPYMREKFEKELERLRAENPDIDIFTIPKFRREYLGEWCKEDSDYVYRIKDDCYIDRFEPDKPTYICGLDIGWHDCSAFVVVGWNKNCQYLNILYSYKRSKMSIDAIAAKIKEIEKIFPGVHFIMDTAGSGALIVANELGTRYGVYPEPAQKTHKEHWIEIFNTEMILNHIRVLKEKCEELIKEIKELPWKYKRDGSREEHSEFDNHLTDALLYAFRHSYPHLEKPKTILSEEDMLYEEALRRAKLKAKRRRY